jgi:DNA-binding SARP family transcriptional activator
MVVGSPESVPPLCIKALGQPQVLLGDAQITFMRHEAVALLVYLAVSKGAHARDALAALLADAPTGEAARARVRRVLAVLRREVGDYLVFGRKTIALARDRSIWLDLAQLEAAVNGNALPADIARLVEAVSLY